VDSPVPPIVSERLELVSMSPAFIEAVLAGADADDPFQPPEWWPDDHDRGFLELRLRQMREDAGFQEWSVRAVVLPDAGRPMIGHAGFHGPPGTNTIKAPQAVELGYTIFEPFRRRGYATEVARALMEWAEQKHGIRHFVASVGPWNEPSLAMMRRLGFEETGRHWDDLDGEELEFELRLAPGGAGSRRAKPGSPRA
jgi:[ribosomal protein S5]-alanine N-acetyltransferase